MTVLMAPGPASSGMPSGTTPIAVEWSARGKLEPPKQTFLSGVLPDQDPITFSITPCPISLVLTRSLLRRRLSIVGRSETP
jgi:hypothetical protein